MDDGLGWGDSAGGRVVDPAWRRGRGDRAEDAAAAWLEAQGFRVVARNVRYRDGELDVVARRGDLVAFVEVRMRSHAAHGEPFETVSFGKQRRVVRAALRWLQRERLLDRVDVRFDVIAVTGRGPDARLLHLPGCFDAGA